MLHLKKFNESFLSENEDIEDVLIELYDIEKPSEEVMYGISADVMQENKPNIPEYWKHNLISFPLNSDLLEYIKLLTTYKSIERRLKAVCDKDGYRLYSSHNGGLRLHISKLEKNDRYVDYEQKFNELIDIDSYYYMAVIPNKLLKSKRSRFMELYFGQFIIGEQGNDQISFAVRVPPIRQLTTFDLAKIKIALSGEVHEKYHRKIFKFGEELDIYKLIISEYPTSTSNDKNVIISHIRDTLRYTINCQSSGRCSTHRSTNGISYLSIFDEQMNKLHPTYNYVGIPDSEYNWRD